MANLLQVTPGLKILRVRFSFPNLLFFILAVLLSFSAGAAFAQTNVVKPVQVKISGYGVLGNRQLKRMLKTLESTELKQATLDASTIEDSALILLAQLRKEGYLKPSIAVQITLTNGQKLETRWTGMIEPPLQRPLAARKVQFKLKKGVLYHYKEVRFEGLKTIPEKKARQYFLETGVLLPLKSTRVYTPERLKSGLANLTEVLQRDGFENAAARVTAVEENDKNGLVRVRITVEEGRKSLVHSVRVETFTTNAAQPSTSYVIKTNQPYSTLWVQDFTQALKATNYHHGYPDTTVTITNLQHNVINDQRVELDLLAQVHTGPLVRVGEINFEGEKRTRQSTMQNRVPLKPGELLDRVKAEEGRTRLARLGIFDTVRLRYEREDEQTRDLRYEVKEGKRTDVNLLFGYGSYEQLRGGFQIEQFNLFGLAHHAELRAIQSFKASRGDFTYTMPEFFGRDIDLFFNGFGLRREEISFLRLEYGGGAGVHKFFKASANDVTVRYNYQVLSATELDPALAAQGALNPNVGAFIFDIRHDRRDNPLYPQRGWKVFATLESASEYFGGDVSYERLELAGSFHLPLGGGRTFSLGASHGLVGSLGSAQKDLPFNKRFFPGGENSIRGFQDGEASPRDAQGRIIGAETYILGTVEFEQALTPKWSLVAFSDNMGFAQKLGRYPMDQALYSVGGGIRWKTIVGPIRLEYGHNLNPRPRDPSGTLHFSLGFPF